MLEFYIKKYHNKFCNKCIAIEKSFNIDLGDDVIINGYIDLVLGIDKYAIESIDYKTGSWCKSFTELQNDTQARLYSIAIKNEYPEFKNYLLTFDYFQKSPITVAFTDKQDLDMIIKIKKRYYDIKNNNYPTRIPLCKNGNPFWKCKSLCDRKLCDDVWRVFIQRYGKEGL